MVTLKILRSLSALKTDRPKEPALGLKWVQITSKTLPLITRQSNLSKRSDVFGCVKKGVDSYLLNDDSK